MARCGFHGGVWHITARLGMVWIGMGFVVGSCLVRRGGTGFGTAGSGMGFLAGLGTVQFGGVGLGEVR